MEHHIEVGHHRVEYHRERGRGTAGRDGWSTIARGVKNKKESCRVQGSAREFFIFRVGGYEEAVNGPEQHQLHQQ